MYNQVMKQLQAMERTKKFVERYGLKVKWISEKTEISNCRLSAWMNGKELLQQSQFDRLTAFLDEYEGYMAGFPYVDE